VIGAELDAWTHEWVRERTELCRATVVRGEQSQAALEQRAGCYAGRLAQLNALLELLLDPQVSSSRLVKAGNMVESLPNLELCRDLDRLQAGTEALTPAQAAELTALRTELSTIGYLRIAGEHKSVDERLTQLRPRVEAIPDRALHVELQVSEAHQIGYRGEYAEARAVYDSALWVAIAIGRDDLAIRILSNLTRMAVQRELDAESGRRSHRHAAALVERHPEYDPTLEADLIHNEAAIEFLAGHYELAREHCEGAQALRERLLPADHPDLMDSRMLLAGISHTLGELKVAQALHEESIAHISARWGPSHPRVADVHYGLSLVFVDQGQYEAAVDHMTRSYELERQRLGDDDDPLLIAKQLNLAAVLSSAGRLEEAETGFARVTRQANEAFEPGSFLHIDLFVQRGNHHGRQGRFDEAIADWSEAIALFEASPDGDRVWTAELRCGIANLELQRGAADLALPLLEQCEPVLREQGNPRERGRAQILLGQALAARGRKADRERIVELCRSAREQLMVAANNGGDVDDEFSELEQLCGAEQPVKG
jgi:eukaryotic-like serine/threonine-protein kinase